MSKLDAKFIIIVLFIVYAISTILLQKAYQREVLVSYFITVNAYISDILTRNIRAYVITGNDEFKRRYFEILNTRDGDGTWETIIAHPWFKNEKRTLSQLFNAFNFNEEELRFIEGSRQESAKLVWTEIVAINMTEGYIDEDNKGKETFDQKELSNVSFIQFNKKVEDQATLKKMKQEAVDMLFSSEYLNSKKKIDVMAYEGEKMIAQREDNKVKSLWYTSNFLLIAIFALFVYYIIYVC